MGITGNEHEDICQASGIEAINKRINIRKQEGNDHIIRMPEEWLVCIARVISPFGWPRIILSDRLEAGWGKLRKVFYRQISKQAAGRTSVGKIGKQFYIYDSSNLSTCFRKYLKYDFSIDFKKHVKENTSVFLMKNNTYYLQAMLNNEQLKNWSFK